MRYAPQTPIANGLRVALEWSQWFRDLVDLVSRLHVGTGSPAGVVVAPPGHLYLNISGGAGTTLYAKEANTDATGWVGK